MANTKFLKEPDYEAIEDFLTLHIYPPDCKNNPGKKKNFREKAARFTIIENQLYYRYAKKSKNKKGPEVLRVVKCINERQRILKTAHDGAGDTLESKAMGGHFGRDKTMARLLDAGVWWQNMNQDVRSYIASCLNCQRAAARMDKAAPELHPIPVPSKVWHQIGVDLCSLPKTSEG